MSDEDFLTVKEVAAQLGISQQAVTDALNGNRLPFTVKMGKRGVAPSDLAVYRQRTQPNGVKRHGRPSKEVA